MKPLIVPSLAVLTLVAGLGSAAARPPEGGYFGFGIGGAIAGGDRGVPLKAGPFVIGPAVGSADYKELVRTDFGSGLAFDLRFGWLVGPVAPEIGIVGHGTTNFEDGAGYPNFSLRFHPLLLVDSLADLKVDASVFLGAGYAIGGYQPKNDTDGKGWEGWALHFGLGATYDLSQRVRLGFDVRFVMPQYSSFMIDWDDDINGKPASTPSTLVVIPTLQIVASF
ncbi:MAG: hypothetical protein U1F43_31725 [Myxococcota bacterium]